MKKEDLKTMYGTPGESFHQTVVQTLDSLEEKPNGRSHGSKRKKLIAIVAVAAALGMLTFTAAATGLFGLVATRTGTYGLNIKAYDDGSKGSIAQGMNMKFGYMPEAYTKGKIYNSWAEYRADEEYFNAYILYTDDYETDYTNVIETSETEYDGHKTLYITFKEAENRDTLFYASLKYFDEYKCMVCCNCSDYDELVKITENVTVEPAPADQKPADVRDDSDDDMEPGALIDYSRNGTGFRDAFLSNKVKQAKIGEAIELSIADYDCEAMKLTAKVKSVKEQDNIDGLDKKDFVNLGLETTYDLFFNGDGTLVKEKRETYYEGADENNLGTAKEVTYTRHFNIIEMELTADGDINDLHRVFGTDSFIFKDNCYFEYMDFDSARSMLIYSTSSNKKLSLKKGEVLTLKIGILSENDTAENTYLSISAIDAPECNYQNYMVKIKE